MGRLGIALGAGGATAWVFHAGVLEVLAEAGLDPASAQLIVGTSAGASVAAALLAGRDPDEVAAMGTRPPTADDRREMLQRLRATPKTLRPLAPGLWNELLPGGGGPVVAFAGLMPPGLFPTEWFGSFPGVARDGTWPERLLVPAVRVDTGQRVVFGRDRSDVSVLDAVEASSAVPGMFRPKWIDGVPHVDGGVRSSTNADLLVDDGVALAVVVAPMSRPGGRVIDRHARRALRSELRLLRESGTPTVVVEGDERIVELSKGFPRRRPGAAGDLRRHARVLTERALG